MDVWRVAAVPVAFVALLFIGCGGSEPPVALPSPSADAATDSPEPLAAIGATDVVLPAKTCADFAAQPDAQDYFVESGGPDEDPHGLDTDHNGRACDEPTPAPLSGAVSSPAPAAAQVVPTPTPGPPKEMHSSSGAVEGHSGGSSSNSSCESSNADNCK